METLKAGDVFATEIGRNRARFDAIWKKLPAFDIEKAIAGARYIHRGDLMRYIVDRKAPVNYEDDCRYVASPHAGIMLWAGEWLVYLADSDEDDIVRDLRMFDAAIIEGEI